MAADPKPLTRDQLAKFLPDQEAIRRFERLFAVAGDLTPTDVATLYRLTQEASIDANNADSKAQMAVDALVQIIQDAAINSGAADSKAAQALDALERVVHSLELLVCLPAPVHTAAQENVLPPLSQPLVSELADVLSTTPVAGNLLVYNATLRRWENALLTAGTSINITNADGSITIGVTGLVIGTNVQAYDADLQAIAALTATLGYLKKTAANTWSIVNPTDNWFFAETTAGQSGKAAGWYTVDFDAWGSIVRDPRSNWNSTSNSYVADVTGLYNFSYKARYNSLGSPSVVGMLVEKNGATGYGASFNKMTSFGDMQAEYQLQLNAGDTVVLRIYCDTASWTIEAGCVLSVQAIR